MPKHRLCVLHWHWNACKSNTRSPLGNKGSRPKALLAAEFARIRWQFTGRAVKRSATYGRACEHATGKGSGQRPNNNRDHAVSGRTVWRGCRVHCTSRKRAYAIEHVLPQRNVVTYRPVAVALASRSRPRALRTAEFAAIRWQVTRRGPVRPRRRARPAIGNGRPRSTPCAQSRTQTDPSRCSRPRAASGCTDPPED